MVRHLRDLSWFITFPEFHSAQDKFVRRCKLVSQTVAEELMEIEGEFLSEDDFETRNFSEWLGF